MNMNYTKFLSVAAVAVALFASCDKSEPDRVPSGTIYIMNEGSYGNNNAEITAYDLNTGAGTAEAFSAVNGRKLGDTANDMLEHDGEIYIAVNTSQVIFVTDRKLAVRRMLEPALPDGTRLSPRYFAESGDKVYVTFYEGWLGEIDPRSGGIRYAQVGPNPEGVDFEDGKIYVANSGGMLYDKGYNNTVSVVDARLFEEISVIEVNTNPKLVKAEDGHLYVTSIGDYASIKPKLQHVDLRNGKVTDMAIENVYDIEIEDDMLYVMTGGYDETYNLMAGDVYACRAEDGAGAKLSKIITGVPSVYSLSVTDRHIWVGSVSNFVENGDMYLYTVDGRFVTSFDAGGLNPSAVVEAD